MELIAVRAFLLSTPESRLTLAGSKTTSESLCAERLENTNKTRETICSIQMFFISKTRK